jgi:hypothetical protein
MSSLKRSYPEGEVDEYKEGDNAASAAGNDSDCGSAVAAAAAAPAKRPRVEAAAAAAGGAAAAAASRSFASSSSILPPRPDRMACSICMEAFESSAKGAAESASRVPRSLPCGHSHCSKCIHERLQRAAGGSVEPQTATRTGRTRAFVRCFVVADILWMLRVLCRAPSRPLVCLAAGCLKETRVAAVTDLPKNFALIDMLDQAELMAAQVELGAPPCQQCDPSQPRRAAAHWCNDCSAFLCAQHNQRVHEVSGLRYHVRMTLAAKAAGRGQVDSPPGAGGRSI